MRTEFPIRFGKAKASRFQTKPDGSGILSVPVQGGTCSFAVDFSGASGAPALLVMAGGVSAKTGGEKAGPNGVTAKTTIVTAGRYTYTVMTLQKGPAPEPKADGDKLAIGGQTIRHDGAEIVFGKMAGLPKPGP